MDYTNCVCKIEQKTSFVFRFLNVHKIIQFNSIFSKSEIDGPVASDLLALDLSQPETIEFAVDIRDSAIIWINNIETDAKYRSWPPTVYDLLRPSFPGMVRSIRKNLFHVVVVIDPIKPDGRDIAKLVESFVVHSAPIRVGIVFDTRKSDAKTEHVYRSLVCAWNYISQAKRPQDALSFLTDVSCTIRFFSFGEGNQIL